MQVQKGLSKNPVQGALLQEKGRQARASERKYYKSITDDPNATASKREEAETRLMSLQVEGQTEEDANFDQDFAKWLLGKGRAQDHARTPWKRTPLTYNDNVVKYLKLYTDSKWKYINQLNDVFQECDTGGTYDTSIKVFFQYYRFFVRGQLDPDDMSSFNFLPFFDELLWAENDELKLVPADLKEQLNSYSMKSHMVGGGGIVEFGFLEGAAAQASKLRSQLTQSEQLLTHLLKPETAKKRRKEIEEQLERFLEETGDAEYDLGQLDPVVASDALVHLAQNVSIAKRRRVRESIKRAKLEKSVETLKELNLRREKIADDLQELFKDNPDSKALLDSVIKRTKLKINSKELKIKQLEDAQGDSANHEVLDGLLSAIDHPPKTLPPALVEASLSLEQKANLKKAEKEVDTLSAKDADLLDYDELYRLGKAQDEIKQIHLGGILDEEKRKEKEEQLAARTNVCDRLDKQTKNEETRLLSGLAQDEYTPASSGIADVRAQGESQALRELEDSYENLPDTTEIHSRLQRLYLAMVTYRQVDHLHTERKQSFQAARSARGDDNKGVLLQGPEWRVDVTPTSPGLSTFADYTIHGVKRIQSNFATTATATVNTIHSDMIEKFAAQAIQPSDIDTRSADNAAYRKAKNTRHSTGFLLQSYINKVQDSVKQRLAQWFGEAETAAKQLQRNTNQDMDTNVTYKEALGDITGLYTKACFLLKATTDKTIDCDDDNEDTRMGDAFPFEEPVGDTNLPRPEEFPGDFGEILQKAAEQPPSEDVARLAEETAGVEAAEVERREKTGFF
jgi:hypothetical protein